MSISNTIFKLSADSQKAAVLYCRNCLSSTQNHSQFRTHLETIDRLYLREYDKTYDNQESKSANRGGDANKFQNVTVPVVLPQVEAAVTYQSSVFLVDTPIFGVVASPEHQDAAMQLETVFSSQAEKGGWSLHLSQLFRDGFKYNIGAVEVNWEVEKVPSFSTDENLNTSVTEQFWSGNTLKRLDPYNTFFDTRVPIYEVHKKGEYAGYSEVYSRVALMQLVENLSSKTVKDAAALKEIFGAGTQSATGLFSSDSVYYVPRLREELPLDETAEGTNWELWGAAKSQSTSRIDYSNTYIVSTVYARIVPSDLAIETLNKNDVQIWKFIIINESIFLHAERLTNAHNYLPILFIQPHADGLRHQDKSLAENVAPFQSVASAMMNFLIASYRRKISDRVVYDSSRISAKHMNTDSPTAKIPVRASVYQQSSVRDAVMPFPYNAEDQGVMGDIQNLNAMANSITGQNPVRQGQFVKGNKTRTEFTDVMSNASGRDRAVALLLEAQLFSPLKQILKLNVLQYQGSVSLFNRDQNREIAVDPVALRQAVLEFKVADGLLSVDKLISAESLTVALQTLGSNAQLNQGYNLTGLFSYFMKTQGVDLRPFEKSEEQLAYEKALAAWNNQVTQMTEQLVGKMPAEEVKQLLSKALPQPTPEQFGYLQPQEEQGEQGEQNGDGTDIIRSL